MLTADALYAIITITINTSLQGTAAIVHKHVWLQVYASFLVNSPPTHTASLFLHAMKP